MEGSPQREAVTTLASDLRNHSSRGSTSRACLVYLVESSGRHIIDETIDRYVARHQRVGADAFDVLKHTLRLIFDSMPVDEMTVD